MTFTFTFTNGTEDRLISVVSRCLARAKRAAQRTLPGWTLKGWTCRKGGDGVEL